MVRKTPSHDSASVRSGVAIECVISPILYVTYSLIKRSVFAQNLVMTVASDKALGSTFLRMWWLYCQDA